MPESTPIYGIPYPCPGETIDSDVFADFANAVDAAMTAVAATSVEALNRPNAKVQLTASDALAAGVELQLTFDVEAWDNDGMANVPAVDALTIQTAGTYLVVGASTIATTGGTFTVAQIALKRNATTLYVRRDNSIDLSAVSLYLTGLIDCVPGDVITLHGQKYGSMTGTASSNSLSARMINRP